MENSGNVLVATGPHDGDNLSIAGGIYRILVSGKQTNGAFAVIEMSVPAGGGPGPHAHAGFQESFYVIEGEVEVKTEETTFTATKGAFVNIPLGGMVHCFKNKSANLAKLLCTVVPAGLEEMFMEIGKPVKAGEYIAPQPIDEETLKKFTAIAEKYGQKLFPPNYLG
ncbi:cupin domain-containing protein [Mucilaginibacter rigui]|uniref:Cupin domain-containing protein n=1 Tax=Mucilaginibacter rigui TaxID=534635 RepID=A0ABR7XA11_9SPHI|nr:cupin domain-containing protein [Mucilaginibacter rigui]MBD1387423.1 cupin domain-containing protein [Mucilaginibacter rigui]